MTYDGDAVIPVDSLDLTPEQDLRLRSVLTIRTGHDHRECVDAADWDTWSSWILGSGDGRHPLVPAATYI
jgi:hypothetical protein